MHKRASNHQLWHQWWFYFQHITDFFDEYVKKDLLLLQNNDDNINEENNIIENNIIEIYDIINTNIEENDSIKDVNVYVANIITIIDEENQKSILEILNKEMEDSICKCFTGRISRLINCLSGFSDKVSIKISTNEEISNIIVVLQNKIDDIDELKRAIAVEMTERGYDEAIINKWLLFVE